MAEQNAGKQNSNRSKLIIRIVLVLLIVGAVGGGLYWYVSAQTVYIDQSVIQAPLVNLSPSNSGNLQAVFVKTGDSVTADQPVAQVGNEIVKAKTGGQIVSVDQNIGEYENAFTGQDIVATMVDPTQLRAVGKLDEDKGLADVKVGDAATFTVDAFGSKQYQGIVDEVSPTSHASDVVFDISDQRPTNQFDIYVRFDPAKYPELKNGMSARMWIYKH
ncbi:MAG TPA: HlyD family efflux transporter periplasmic adaptor subunit [Candidatus Paceibacterota bacterium]|nr:HlyD family efflux transporter periplasmic adaptor subunit [Candidatus Paceibacterota bacterium]